PLAGGPSRSHEGPSEEDPGAAHIRCRTGPATLGRREDCLVCDHHSKKTSRSNGQKRRVTLPMMLPTGTGPNVRESDEKVRLSPITKICPAGTAYGYATCGA